MTHHMISFLILGCLTASAQNDSGSVPLRDVIGRLETQHGIKFSYVDQWIAGVSVRLPLTGQTVEEQVTAALRGTNLGFRHVTKGHIALFKNGEPIRVPSEKPANVLKDSVREQSTAAALPDVHFAAVEEVVVPLLPAFQDTTRLEPEITSADEFFHFSLWKNIHTDPRNAGLPSRHNVSFNVLSNREMEIQGFELGLLGNSKRVSVEGLQIGIGGNSTTGSMSGIQVGGGWFGLNAGIQF